LPPASHVPRKRFGQHFLHDAAVVRRIVEAVAPAPGDFVLEIGPGEGVLTRPLRSRAGRFEAIEIDRALAAALAGEGVAVHVGDALEFDYGALPEGARVVGNLPYNISTPLLFRLAGQAARFRDLHFMLQREVVERMVAAPSTPAYGRLSVMRLVPRAVPLDTGAEGFADLVRRAFSARRKTLRNALGLEPEALAALGLEARLRPENLAPEDYVRIARRTISPVG